MLELPDNKIEDAKAMLMLKEEEVLWMPSSLRRDLREFLSSRDSGADISSLSCDFESGKFPFSLDAEERGELFAKVLMNKVRLPVFSGWLLRVRVHSKPLMHPFEASSWLLACMAHDRKDIFDAIISTPIWCDSVDRNVKSTVSGTVRHVDEGCWNFGDVGMTGSVLKTLYSHGDMGESFDEWFGSGEIGTDLKMKRPLRYATLLSASIGMGCSWGVKTLLDRGCSPDGRNSGQPRGVRFSPRPLMVAAALGDEESFAYLLDAGASLRSQFGVPGTSSEDFWLFGMMSGLVVEACIRSENATIRKMTYEKWFSLPLSHRKSAERKIDQLGSGRAGSLEAAMLAEKASWSSPTPRKRYSVV